MTRPTTIRSVSERAGASPRAVPAVRCSVLTADVPIASAASAESLHRRTRERGRVLFASHGETDHTIVVTRSVLRVVVRGDTARVQALEPAARPLLEALRERLPDAVADGEDVCVPVPTGAAADQSARGAVDRDVLRAPCLFDPVRAVVALVGDRQPGSLPVGLFGAFAFDLVDRFESLGPRRPDAFDDPDLELVFGLDTVTFDHTAGIARVATRGLPWESMAAVRARHEACLELLRDGRSQPETAVDDLDADAAGCRGTAVRPDAEFLAGVATLREHIAAGDIFQAVLSRAVQFRCAADALDVFRTLASREPASYAFHLELERGALLGCSPETCLRVDGRTVEIRPIAGTAARGADADTDGRLALALLFDAKERAEHVMLLDLARNDVARVAVPGTTAVVQQFAIEQYSRVQHMVSRVRGELRPGLDALHAYRAAANMGTLTGAPKARAIELVRALEPEGRGFYGGAVGYLLADGSFDSCITIRSLRAVDGVFRAQAGAGIVWHSDPGREFEETERKLRALREVMALCGAAPGGREVHP